MSIYFFMTIIGRLVNIYVLNRYRPSTAYRFYALSCIVLLAIIFVSPSASVFTVLFPVIGFFAGCLFPTNLALANEKIPEEFSLFMLDQLSLGELPC